MPDPETVEIEDGVTVSSPDTSEDVSQATPAEPTSMAEAVEAAMAAEGEPSSPGTEDEAGQTAGTPPPTDDTTEGAKPDATTEPDASAQSEAPPEGDPTEDELKHYSQKANARIRGLVEERNEARGRVAEIEPVLKVLDENNIARGDLDLMVDLSVRLSKGDFAGFLEGVTPYVDLARQYTGQALPADLQQKVQQGYVSPDIAKELAQKRAAEQIEQGRAQTAQNQLTQQQNVQRAETIRGAVVNWERGIKQSDPDYPRKVELIRRTSQALMQEHGAPQTPEQALQLANAAYEEVNGQMERLRPPPKATTRQPTSTGQGGPAPAAEPTSMMEAALQGLDAARA